MARAAAIAAASAPESDVTLATLSHALSLPLAPRRVRSR
jgi:hypothetical protein